MFGYNKKDVFRFLEKISQEMTKEMATKDEENKLLTHEFGVVRDLNAMQSNEILRLTAEIERYKKAKELAEEVDSGEESCESLLPQNIKFHVVGEQNNTLQNIEEDIQLVRDQFDLERLRMAALCAEAETLRKELSLSVEKFELKANRLVHLGENSNNKYEQTVGIFSATTL